MRVYTLTADDEVLTAHVPDSWDEVGLAAYALLAAADSVPLRCDAVAALCQVPARALHEDVSLLGRLWELLPVALITSLPAATGPVPSFQHLGVTYVHQGNLHRINAGQLEALYTFNKAAEGKPAEAGPGLLAVLYCRKGKEQTPEVVRDAAAAFASLPMSVAWPALAAFMRSSGSASANILSVSALSQQVGNLLSQLEQQMATGSTTYWRKPLRSLVRRWVSSARKTR